MKARREPISSSTSCRAPEPRSLLGRRHPASEFDTYLAALPAALLADTYERFGTRLLELNVRAFLGVRGRKSVNAGLRRTMVSEPHHFLAYNNGIVATVDEIETVVSADGGHAITRLVGPADRQRRPDDRFHPPGRRQDRREARRHPGAGEESSGSAAQSWVRWSARFRSLPIARIRSSPADFSANDPFHVTVEELANNTWIPGATGRWFYERARGSYGAAETKASYSRAQQRKFRAETPKQRRFSKTDLAKTLNVWARRPDLVSYGNQKNFQHFMQQLKQDHPDGLIPDAVWYRHFIAKMMVFRAVQDMVKSLKVSGLSGQCHRLHGFAARAPLRA